MAASEDTQPSVLPQPRFKFYVDRGGTFCDILAEVTHQVQGTKQCIVRKLLSVDPTNYQDAPTEGIRRILEEFSGIPHPIHAPVDSTRIDEIRMGTTVATNALLERKGERCVFVVTQGFRDLLHIGNQSRPRIFDLEIKRPAILYEQVIEIEERVRLMNATTTSAAVIESAAASSTTSTSTSTSTSSTASTSTSSTTASVSLSTLPIIKEVVGVTGETVQVIQTVDVDKTRQLLTQVYQQGIRSLAVCLMHAYTFDEHEKIIGNIAQEIGFTQISLSHQLMPMVKIVPRGYTTLIDAYLTPCIQTYLHRFTSGFDQSLLKNARVSFMQSDGGLAPIDSFYGFRALLSGPAGGVIGYSRTAFNPVTREPVIGFDMGGTSTDVGRYAGEIEHTFETTTAGVPVMAPQMDINTVAAGGGSMLFFRSGLFVVGPESASADPGPACYRKGGPLAVTDANLLLGRLLPEYFPHIFGKSQAEPLDVEATRRKFDEMTATVNAFFASQGKPPLTPEQVALGFIAVANEAMCRPIRALTQAKGYDLSKHILACFGGAGGQHACSIARSLGMKKVFVHKFAGILSAYGIGLADVVQEEQAPAQMKYLPENLSILKERLDALAVIGKSKLKRQGFADESISTEYYLNLRYEGTDTALMTLPDAKSGDFAEAFSIRYKQEYGFTLSRPLIVDDIRVRVIGKTDDLSAETISRSSTYPAPPTPEKTAPVYFEEGCLNAPVYLLHKLGADDSVAGPAIIIDKTSTILVEPGCHAVITNNGDVSITVSAKDDKGLSHECDPIQLAIFSHRFMSIAEQMGRTLQRTSISTNIKERLDFSCALFDGNGGLIANAPHLPVHLGAMQEAVRFQIKQLGSDWKDGDVVVANHPAAGGSHLPDITVITPVFSPESSSPVFFVASRGHHADIGGIFPGSMPPFSKHLYQEGAAILSFKLVSGGVFDEKGITEILMSPEKIVTPADEPRCSGTRNLSDNLSDLKAQVAANQKGIQLMQDLIEQYGLSVVSAYMGHIQANAELAVREMLQTISSQHGNVLQAVDYMDDGTPISLKITINAAQGSAHFDFSGTGPQVYANWNAPLSVTKSAIIYCLRCLVQRDIPLNQGCLNPVTVHVPDECLLNPSADAAVVGGNVLTSQRVVDVILRAFQACAASQGCMNNFTVGNSRFGYYETIAGGAGAGPSWHGSSGVHTHMTNTRITDPEIVERRYPMILREFSLRPHSGGLGKFRGGDGVVREIEFLDNLSIGILSERRAFRPYGLQGGDDGQSGQNLIIRKDGRILNLGPKNTYSAKCGDRIRILTPGGGGFGSSAVSASSSSVAAAAASVTNAVAPMSGSVYEYQLMQEQA